MSKPRKMNVAVSVFLKGVLLGFLVTMVRSAMLLMRIVCACRIVSEAFCSEASCSCQVSSVLFSSIRLCAEIRVSEVEIMSRNFAFALSSLAQRAEKLWCCKV